MVGCLELELAEYRVSISGIHQTFFAQRVHDDGSHSVSSLTVARVFPNVTVGYMHAHFARILRVDEDRVSIWKVPRLSRRIECGDAEASV